ncbi:MULTISPECIES: hypothetical protein [Pseudomonas fluorescens group]|uniref:Uncharacterized protein n=1 Tax=Pseudomonas fluorescens TaxID=294 RepID=A0AAE2U3L2_PSEFL|nr:MULTISPECIES: hypothetical protein [Pseudomonas fluorescens group]MBA1430350.1 hypothetical protein [Pseudomonas orientalis]MBD8271971.1 hypothetical protein [Pseudomonas fluorescens]MDF2795102.1 hypothetical protein [Pseudomonas orientalis]
MSDTTHNDAPKSGTFSGTIGSLIVKGNNASMSTAGNTFQFNSIQHHSELGKNTYSFLHVVLMSETPSGKYSFPKHEQLLRLSYSESNPRDVLMAKITEGSFEVISDKSGRYILSFDVVLGAVNKIKAVGKFEFTLKTSS